MRFPGLLSGDTLKAFRSVGNDLLVTLDGTEYYRSDHVHCRQCDVTHHSSATISYRHALITPAIVKAGREDVIAPAPEFIRTDDGRTKAENEIVAAKRWLGRMAERLSPMSVTAMGDNIYATQPFLSEVRGHEMNFLLHTVLDLYDQRYQLLRNVRGRGGPGSSRNVGPSPATGTTTTGMT